MASALPQLPPVAKLSTSVIRVLGGNPNKFTLQGTNTYLLGTGSRRLLLDTAQGFPIWKDSLARVLQDEKATISLCVLSHWHNDHIGGVADFRATCPDATIWKGFGNEIDPEQGLSGVSVLPIEDGSRFTDDAGLVIEAVLCPGHTQDHMAFVIRQSTDASEVGAIFTGDNVLGHGTAVFEDLAQYLRSLHQMKHVVPPRRAEARPTRAYPGHGAVIEDASAKIDEYIEHRRMREEEALNVLRYGATKAPPGNGGPQDDGVARREWQSMDMVKVIYRDVPEHLHVPAERGLLMVLAKLQGEGKVTKVDGKWKVDSKAAL